MHWPRQGGPLPKTAVLMATLWLYAVLSLFQHQQWKVITKVWEEKPRSMLSVLRKQWQLPSRCQGSQPALTKVLFWWIIKNLTKTWYIAVIKVSCCQSSQSCQADVRVVSFANPLSSEAGNLSDARVAFDQAAVTLPNNNSTLFDIHLNSNFRWTKNTKQCGQKIRKEHKTEFRLMMISSCYSTAAALLANHYLLWFETESKKVQSLWFREVSTVKISSCYSAHGQLLQLLVKNPS